MATKHDFHKVIIGRAELLALVDYDVKEVPAKTDTGAFSSAIHATNIHVDTASGMLSCELFSGHSACGELRVPLATNDFTTASITSSSGVAQERFVVRLKVKLGPKVFVAEFTLADRSKLTYPILLGRKLLNHRFLVDPAETSVSKVALNEVGAVKTLNDEEVTTS